MRRLLLLAFCLFILPVEAQSPRLDPTLPAEHGSTILGAAFSPDPYRAQSIEAGGPVDISEVLRGDDCTGFASSAPDYEIDLRGEVPLLRLIFVADLVTSDAMMVVRTPSGDMLCVDDSYGVFAPSVDLSPAPSGVYSVWIGAFTADPVYGSLYVTRRSDVIPNSSGVIVPRVEPTATPPGYVEPTGIPGTYLDPTLAPHDGSMTLAAGFTPDPVWSFATAGGSLDVPAFDLQNAAEQITMGGEIGGGSLGAVGSGLCGGYTSSAPAFALDWSGQSGYLSLFYVAVSAADDASMVVCAPDGTWVCSRDVESDVTLDPQVTFANPPEGRYTIWLGNELSRDQTLTGALYVTELPGQSPLTVTLPHTEPLILPINGLTGSTNAIEFKLDPLLVPVSGGGLIEVEDSGCPGFYPSGDSVALALPSSQPYLRVFIANQEPSSADPTLIASMPDGRWYCGDDWEGLTNPVIDILGGTGTGVAHLWAGSYNADETYSAVIGITRGAASPINLP